MYILYKCEKQKKIIKSLYLVENKNYNINLLKEGYYSEVTTKNYSAHQSKIDNIINNIPKYNF